MEKDRESAERVYESAGNEKTEKRKQARQERPRSSHQGPSKTPVAMYLISRILAANSLGCTRIDSQKCGGRWLFAGTRAGIRVLPLKLCYGRINQKFLLVWSLAGLIPMMKIDQKKALCCGKVGIVYKT
uniref:Uncharacterized protein n=1 Tax=Strigamia maritima TaxID=126957 RepID=T1JIP3_STRMM